MICGTKQRETSPTLFLMNLLLRKKTSFFLWPEFTFGQNQMLSLNHENIQLCFQTVMPVILMDHVPHYFQMISKYECCTPYLLFYMNKLNIFPKVFRGWVKLNNFTSIEKPNLSRASSLCQEVQLGSQIKTNMYTYSISLVVGVGVGVGVTQSRHSCGLAVFFFSGDIFVEAWMNQSSKISPRKLEYMFMHLIKSEQGIHKPVLCDGT